MSNSQQPPVKPEAWQGRSGSKAHDPLGEASHTNRSYNRSSVSLAPRLSGERAGERGSQDAQHTNPASYFSIAKHLLSLALHFMKKRETYSCCFRPFLHSRNRQTPGVSPPKPEGLSMTKFALVSVLELRI
jgi:hypothetical protein